MRCENFNGKPVCGSDGILYENLCHLQLESCSLQVNITMDTSEKCESYLLFEKIREKYRNNGNETSDRGTPTNGIP